MSSGHFEAKKHAVRQTQDGWVVSFVVHPNDMVADFATAPLGTRYMVGFAQIGDDEQPIPSAGKSTTPSNSLAGNPQPKQQKGAVSEPDNRVGPLNPPSPKPAGEHKRSWHTLPPQQRAGMLCSDKAFQAWVSKMTGWECNNKEDTRDWLCLQVGVNSRAEIPLSEMSWNAYDKLEEQFMREAGRVPEIK